MKSAILTLMANGLKDEVIAKRMSLSVRACRGHIAGLLEMLNARSRFQAGVIAARTGLLEPKNDKD
ncbi:response regulator transcription factor [Streptacidiphilus sp. 4-A2]|nr:response regulator transcription factor [Streptacidiphilus sp. 4-A2]